MDNVYSINLSSEDLELLRTSLNFCVDSCYYNALSDESNFDDSLKSMFVVNELELLLLRIDNQIMGGKK